MDKMIDKIYELIYSPILTPYNLLPNAKLDNYEYVNYYKQNDGLIAEMKCKVGNSFEIFYYYFDENDFLQEIYRLQDGIRELIYSRKDEIRKYETLYKNDIKKKVIQQVV